MLSKQERQALREFDREVAASDPEFAELMHRGLPARSINMQRLAYDLVAALATILATVCVVLGAIGAGVGAGSFAALVLAIRCWKFPLRRQKHGFRVPER